MGASQVSHGGIWTLVVILMGLSQAVSAQVFPRGEVIPRVLCAKDSSQSYALYLPRGYTPERRWPLLYVFDPAARGELAVRVFEAAAERYGYILAGSNNAQNGPWEPIFSAINAMSPDLDQRFSIDGRRLYATGFSGGSRVASLVGIETGGLAGVIGCGAGFPQFRSPGPSVSFDYVGLTGNRDMNYLEMQNLEKDLLQVGIRHIFITFEGGHEWPPLPAVMAAMQWLEFRAMERGIIPADTLVVAQYLRQMEDSLQRLVQTKDTFGQYLLAQEVFTTLSGVPGAEAAREFWFGEISRLATTEEVSYATARRQELAYRERAYLARYMDAFQAVEMSPFQGDSLLKSPAWWKREVKALNVMIDQADEEEGLLGNRMIDYLWRGAFVRWKASFDDQQYQLAGQFAQIWSLVQPLQPGPHYAWAKTDIARGAYKRGIAHLEKAIELNFSNRAYLEQDTVFDPVRENKKFKVLLEAIPGQ